MKKKQEFSILTSIPMSDLRQSRADKFVSNVCIDVPFRWKQKLPADFRPIQWVLPRAFGAKPLGYFESVLHDFNTRSKTIFLWHEGDKYLQIIPRPVDLLPAEPLPSESLEKPCRRISRQSRRILCQKKLVDDFSITLIEYARHKVIKYNYNNDWKTVIRLDAGLSPTKTTLDQRNSCGGSCQSIHSESQVTSPWDIYYSVSLSTSSNQSNQSVSLINAGRLSPCYPSPASDVDVFEAWPIRKDLPDLNNIHVMMVPHRKVQLEAQVIGQGTFGSVRLAQLSGVGQVVVKSFNELSTSEDILREARIMAALAETSFIPKLFGVCYGRDFRVSIIQEYFAKGLTLFDVLVKYKLPGPIWIHIAKQLVLGVKTIHDRGVLINDLKNDNILIDVESWNFELKFIDFGLSSYGEGRVFKISPEHRPRLIHMAPEVLEGHPTTPASDVYSIGIILEDISFQCKDFVLCDLVDACLGPAGQRPTCDVLLKSLEKLF